MLICAPQRLEAFFGTTLVQRITIEPVTAYLVLDVVSCIFPYVLAPRSVLSVRELSANGFGASQCMSRNASTMVFASVAEILVGEGDVGGEGITEGARHGGESRDWGVEMQGDLAADRGAQA
ncbi:hypothetical protein PAXINDRAFT_168606 [Paxillus involutus ATCC 200175]|nr:hypothetical protein PAXINDRAFT_168606 [Paxillus involutus ATCC 200175]